MSESNAATARYVSPIAIANRLRVSTRTVLRWADDGVFGTDEEGAVVKTKGGHRRVRWDAVEAVAARLAEERCAEAQRLAELAMEQEVAAR